MPRTFADDRPHVEPLEVRLLLDAAPAQPLEFFDASPAVFVENQGQWADEPIFFAFQRPGASIAFTDEGPVFCLYSVVGGDESNEDADPWQVISPEPTEYETITFRALFKGADVVTPVGLDPVGTCFNYYVGDSSQWRSNVTGYSTIAYFGIYEGIDLYLYGGPTNLKYEFHVAPGADWSQIVVSYEGTDGLSIDLNGDLRVQTSLGELVEDAPYIYQNIDGEQVEVTGSFKLVEGDSYTFRVEDSYDATQPLVLDPDLKWLTYLGSSGDDYGQSIAVDASGNVLVTGRTYSSGWASTGFDTTYNGSGDTFVAKLSPGGAHLWSTYVGGSATDEGLGIAVDSFGNVLVTGYTRSSGWVSEGFDVTQNGGVDAFVLKLSPGGAHLWSTYLGGNSDDYGRSIAVDASGDVLVTGETRSSGWVSEGFDVSLGGVWDAFVAKLSPGGEHMWSTYLGGNDIEYGLGIAVDLSGDVLVTGQTGSSDWISGGFDTTHNGWGDAFVVKLSAAGQHVWSTYLGGSSHDSGYGIAVDAFGGVLVTGETRSAGWVSGGYDTTLNGDTDAFVVKLSASGSHIWSAYLGGGDVDEGYSIAVDASGNVLVTGDTSSSGWVTGGFDTTYNGSTDAFVTKLSPDGARLWSTYLGGSNSDRGRGIAAKTPGNVLVTGWWYSPWPGGGHGGRYDGFVAEIVEPIPGDANGDGKVDSSDLAIWQQNYNPINDPACTWAMGDWNRDTRIDSADLALWQQNYDPLGPSGQSGEPLLLGTADDARLPVNSVEASAEESSFIPQDPLMSVAISDLMTDDTAAAIGSAGSDPLMVAAFDRIPVRSKTGSDNNRHDSFVITRAHGRLMRRHRLEGQESFDLLEMCELL